MREATALLKHLDNPVRILSFPVSDIIAYAVPFFVGTLFDSLLIVPAGGIGLVLIAKKILKRFPRFYGMRFLYWSLPTQRFNRMMKIKLPFSNKRFWVN